MSDVEPHSPGEPEARAGALPVFTAGERSVSLDQIIQAADFRGDLDRYRIAWHTAQARSQYAQEQGLEPDTAECEKVAEAFRYARDLVSAEECERWFTARRLTLDDFSEYCRHRYWAERRDIAVPARAFDRGSPDGVAALADPDAVRQFRISLLLTDDFAGLARPLAWRLALACEGTPPFTNDVLAEETSRFLDRHKLTQEALPAWLAHWGGAPEWFDELLGLEAGFQTETARLLTRENQQRALVNLRLPLLRLDLEILELESAAAAREAFLCVSEDKIPMAELAEQNHYPFRRTDAFLDQLPTEWRPALVSASAGAVLPPLVSENGFQLCRLVAKRDPSLADAEVRTEVKAALQHGHFMELETRHIRWLLNLEVEQG